MLNYRLRKKAKEVEYNMMNKRNVLRVLNRCGITGLRMMLYEYLKRNGITPDFMVEDPTVAYFFKDKVERIVKDYSKERGIEFKTEVFNEAWDYIKAHEYDDFEDGK